MAGVDRELAPDPWGDVRLVSRSRMARDEARRLKAAAEQLRAQGKRTRARRGPEPPSPTAPRIAAAMGAHPAGKHVGCDQGVSPTADVEVMLNCFDDASQAVLALQRTALRHIAGGGDAPVSVARAALTDSALMAGVVRRALYAQARRGERNQPGLLQANPDIPYSSGRRMTLTSGKSTEVAQSLRRRRELARRLAEPRARLHAGLLTQREALKAVERGCDDPVTLARNGLEAAARYWNDLTAAAYRRLREAAAAL